MRGGLRLPMLVFLGGLAWAAAHWVAHRIVMASAPGAHGAGHDSSGAGATTTYLSASLPLCLSLAVGLVAIASLHPGRISRKRSLWLFGAVPVLGFAGELLASPPDSIAVAAAAVLGVVAVQLAVALLALRAARELLVLADCLVQLLARARPVGLPSAGPVFSLVVADRAPASRLHAGGGPRAPPAFLQV